MKIASCKLIWGTVTVQPLILRIKETLSIYLYALITYQPPCRVSVNPKRESRSTETRMPTMPRPWGVITWPRITDTRLSGERDPQKSAAQKTLMMRQSCFCKREKHFVSYMLQICSFLCFFFFCLGFGFYYYFIFFFLVNYKIKVEEKHRE